MRQFFKKFLAAPAIKPRILFYASAAVDEIWIRSTALACKDKGMNVVLAVSQGELRPDILENYRAKAIPVYQNADRNFLRRCQGEIAVTASSGLPADWFSDAVRWRVHMPHSIASLHMIYTEDTFDGYNLLLAVGPHHKAEFEALSARRGLEGRHVLPCGYGKLDILMEENKSARQPAEQKHILLAPSWGERNILSYTGIDLIAAILDKGYYLTVRPHPLFFIEKDPSLKEMRDRFGSNGSFVLESSLDTGTAMHIADVLISDYSGTAQEFAALRGKPVVFIDVPKKILNPVWEELGIEPIELQSRGVLGPVSQPNTEAVLSAIKDVLANPDNWQKQIADFEPRYLYGRNCAAVACRHLGALLDGTDMKELAA